jgi:hypothetical protein
MVENPRSQGVAGSAGRVGDDAQRDIPCGAARRLNEPRPALVEAGVDGTPGRVNRRGVALVREEWRVVDRWWTEEPISRRYFELVLESGENLVVFRDEERASWFAQRA